MSEPTTQGFTIKQYKQTRLYGEKVEGQFEVFVMATEGGGLKPSRALVIRRLDRRAAFCVTVPDNVVEWDKLARMESLKLMAELACRAIGAPYTMLETWEGYWTFHLYDDGLPEDTRIVVAAVMALYGL